MTKEQTPKTPRSIVRNHSPYSESTGPIVQEGFVAARVRALQGFSDQSQNVTRSHYPLTPCPLHVYKLHSPPRPSSSFKPLLTGSDLPDTYAVKRFHTQALSKDRRNLVDVPRVTARSSDVAFSFQPEEQQRSLGSTTPCRSPIGGRGAGIPSSTPFNGIVLSSCADRSQDHATASNTTHDPLAKLDRFDVDVHAVNLSTSEEPILSPHAIKADLVEPWATWNCLSQTEDRNNDYTHEQPLKPRGSIADKLGSLVEQGWEGGDVFGTDYADGELTSHTTDSTTKISDTRLDSRTDTLVELSRLKQVPSHSGSLSLSDAEKPNESQHSDGQSTPPNLKQKEPKAFVYQGPQKRRKREAKRSHAENSPQRSTSDAGLRYLKAELAIRDGKRRAWTLPRLRHSESDHRQIQAKASPTSWPSYAWDHHGSQQPKSGFDLNMLRDEQDSAALLKMNVSRRSSANTKSSTRSGSKSISFFKKFPWYKVALVDKQPVAHSFSKRSWSDDRTSTANRAAYPDPKSNHVELSRSVHTPIECGDEEENNSPKTKTAPHQGPIDQQAIDDITSNYKTSSQPSIRLMISPQQLDERQSPEQDLRVQEHSHDAHATSFKFGEERLAKKPDQDVIAQKHGWTRAGRFRAQPRASSQSGSISASSEPQVAFEVLQSFQTQGPQVMEQSHVQSHSSSHAKLMNLHADKSLEEDSSSSKTAKPEQGFPAGPSLFHVPRSDVVSLTPKCLGGGTSSSLPNVERSDQDGPMPRETHGSGNGIKKIQVTVTFDGAEDLVVEATLRKRD